MRYNSTLAPKSDAYFSEVHLKGDPPSKPATLEQHGKADTPNISISEGEVERHKTSNSSLTVGADQTQLDRSAADSEDAVEEGTVTTDDLSALENSENVNKNGTEDIGNMVQTPPIEVTIH